MCFEVITDAILAVLAAICICSVIYKVFSKSGFDSVKSIMLVCASSETENLSEIYGKMLSYDVTDEVIIIDKGVKESERAELSECFEGVKIFSPEELCEYIKTIS